MGGGITLHACHLLITERVIDGKKSVCERTAGLRGDPSQAFHLPSVSFRFTAARQCPAQKDEIGIKARKPDKLVRYHSLMVNPFSFKKARIVPDAGGITAYCDRIPFYGCDSPAHEDSHGFGIVQPAGVIQSVNPIGFIQRYGRKQQRQHALVFHFALIRSSHKTVPTGHILGGTVSAECGKFEENFSLIAFQSFSEDTQHIPSTHRKARCSPEQRIQSLFIADPAGLRQGIHTVFAAHGNVSREVIKNGGIGNLAFGCAFMRVLRPQLSTREQSAPLAIRR